MKEINSQLTDAMIIALADAQQTGVNFSDSVEIAKIPEVAVVEANEYWHFLSRQNDLSLSILPDISIIDSLFVKLDEATKEATVKESTPSPYMKYVMVFAAPLSIFVMILGISFRGQPVVDTTPSSDLRPIVSTNTALTNEAAPAAEDTAAPKARMMSAKAAQGMITAEDIATGDPKQLFAMLSEAGTQEAQSDVNIDDQYDAQLSALDSIVIDSDNSNTYAPL